MLISKKQNKGYIIFAFPISTNEWTLQQNITILVYIIKHSFISKFALCRILCLIRKLGYNNQRVYNNNITNHFINVLMYKSETDEVMHQRILKLGHKKLPRIFILETFVSHDYTERFQILHLSEYLDSLANVSERPKFCIGYGIGRKYRYSQVPNK